MTLSFFGHQFNVLFSIIGIPVIIISLILIIGMLAIGVACFMLGPIMGFIGVFLALILISWPTQFMVFTWDQMYANTNHAECSWITENTRNPSMYYGHTTLQESAKIEYRRDKQIYDNYDRCWEEYHGGASAVTWR